MNKSEIIREYIKEHPSVKGNLTIAKALAEKYPLLFHNVEAARSIVRSVKGNHGDAKRNSIKDPEKLKYFEKSKETGFSPIEGDIEKCEPFVIPLSVGPLNIWSDIHCPYHDHNALKKAHARKEGNALLINGDGLDMYLQSRYVQDPKKVRKYDLRAERDIAKELFSQICEEFDQVYYKKGNHDARWEQYLKVNAPVLYDMEEFKMEIVYGLVGMGMKIIESNQLTQYGDLDIIHGHENAGRFGSGKFPSKTLIKKWQQHKKKMEVKILCSHIHYVDEYKLHNDDSSWAYGWTTGCLSSLHADYNPFNKYEHGFAIAREGKNGVEVENIKL